MSSRVMNELMSLSAENKAKFDSRVDRIVEKFLNKCRSNARRGVRRCRSYFLVLRDVREIASAASSAIVDEFGPVNYDVLGPCICAFEVTWEE